ncbi:MAG: DegT/DnrJ/EryC1/StrS family aminotransferase [Acidobacteria bacterium]|nr:DegT/DnrJ/EryC1/StrS family aminotransferase [Acidobacteriota bacterium]
MISSKKIPFLELATPHVELEEELVSVFKEALHTAGFIGGPMVDDFEREFAQFCEVSHCVGVNSGTDALRFCLIAAGITNGEIVLTVPNTFIATAEAISQAGARPDFVDVDERTYNLDPEKLREYVETQCEVDGQTGKLVNRRLGRVVAGVIPVHLYGQMADMDPILELAERYNLIVIEDACQAHGAEYCSRKENRWKKAGSMGGAAAFSFYPGKNLGACGEAGAVTTNDEQMARKVRMLRDHGQAQKYYHEMEGYNGRLDAIQAGILRVKLRLLPEWNQQRRQKALRYNELLHDVEETIIPYEPTWSRAVYHLYVIRSRRRDELRKHLEAEQISTGLHYPLPLHLQNAYRFLGFKQGDFANAERVASQVLSLPMYPQLPFNQLEAVGQKISRFIFAQTAAVT